MERESIREQVRAVVIERLGQKTAAPPDVRKVESAPADLVSWRRFDDPRDAPRRALVTEADVMRARMGTKILPVAQGAIVTPLARETAARLGVTLEAGSGRSTPAEQPHAGSQPRAAARKAVALGADHGGFALKERLKSLVTELGCDAIDLGTKDAAPVDYPDFAHRVAEEVTSGRAAFGIMVDGVGVGSAMAANRHPGIRAAPCSTTLQAHSAREHNDANVLTLGGRHLGEDVALAIVKAFLETAFAGGRHVRRVEKIDSPGRGA